MNTGGVSSFLTICHTCHHSCFLVLGPKCLTIGKVTMLGACSSRSHESEGCENFCEGVHMSESSWANSTLAAVTCDSGGEVRRGV